MVYKVDLNSNDYFTTNNINTTANRTYGIDWSFLKDDKKYLMDYSFLSRHTGTQFYPPVGFTGASGAGTTITGQAYGNGAYTVSASSTPGSNVPWTAFDKTDLYWRCASNYNSTTGLYNNSFFTNTATQGDVYGEWLQILLPNPITLDKFFISSRNATASIRPKNIKIVGSNNVSNPWNIVYESDNLAMPPDGSQYYLSYVPPAYQFYRLIILTTNGNGGTPYTEVRELALFDYNNPPQAGLISINNGSFPQSVRGGSSTNKQYTNLAGILKVRQKTVYCNPNHHQSILYNKRPDNNFITIDLFNTGGKNPITTNNPYLMSLYFSEYKE